MQFPQRRRGGTQNLTDTGVHQDTPSGEPPSAQDELENPDGQDTDVESVKHPELATTHISPHTLLSTTAMHLLQAVVDISVIALWLGHESPPMTYLYMEADLKMKEQALARVQPPSTPETRYRPPDSLLAFLQSP